MYMYSVVRFVSLVHNIEAVIKAKDSYGSRRVAA